MRWLLICLCVSASLQAAATEVSELSLGEFRIQLAGQWKFEGTKSRKTGVGPNGEGLIVNRLSLKKGAPAEVRAQHQAMISRAATELLPQTAAKLGTVTRGVRLDWTANGKSRHSIVSRSSEDKGSKFFVQYLFGSPESMVYLTIEGKGNWEDAGSILDDAARALDW